MSVEPSWGLLVALVILTAAPAVISAWTRLGVTKDVVVASVRATVQLAAISTIIVFVIAHVWSSVLFVLAMFAIAVFTTTGTVHTRNVWWWSAASIAAGVVPVLVVIFATGTAPFNGYSLVPIGSIIIGNVMRSHTLMGRHLFPALKDKFWIYEAALALGLPRYHAISMIIDPIAAEPLVPNIDATRTVGLVTLPGAFIGVLLGGGSVVQAGAAQILVIIGIMAGQTIQVAVSNWLIRHAKLLPADLKERLRP